MKRGWIIFILAFGLYFVSIFGGFIQDDTKVILGDPDMGKVSALAASFARPYYYMDGGNAGIYRPLTSFSLYLNALVTGSGAWGFHLINVLLFAGVCWLVFELLKKVFSEKMAFWGAVVFAVMPIHTEAVNYIVGRAEILSLAFVILATIMQSKKKWEVSALMLLFGLMSKETAIVGLPVLIYLLITGKEKRDTKTGVISFYVLVTVCYFVLRMMVLGGDGLGNNATVVENPLKFVSMEQRVMNAFALVPFGVDKVVFPWHLSYDYSFNQLKLMTSWFDWRVLLGISLLVLSGVCLYRLPRRFTPRNDGMVIGMMMFWGPIAITGNFLFSVGTIFGERLWFWPSLGVILIFMQLLRSCRLHTFSGQTEYFPREYRGLETLLMFPCPCEKISCYAVRKVVGKRHPAIRTLRNPAEKGIGYVALLIVALYTGRAFVRNLDWLSQERLFIHDASYVKDSVMAQSNAAAVCLIKKDLVKGKEYLERAEKIYPTYPELMNNWGMYYLWLGDTKMAKEKFDFCLKEKPGYYLCENNIKLLK